MIAVQSLYTTLYASNHTVPAELWWKLRTFLNDQIKMKSYKDFIQKHKQIKIGDKIAAQAAFSICPLSDKWSTKVKTKNKWEINPEFLYNYIKYKHKVGDKSSILIHYLVTEEAFIFIIWGGCILFIMKMLLN